jgi:hypothetical protein
MASDQQLEVYRQLRTSQDKYIYFLLAAAGAAIALAVNQTQGLTLNWSQLPLGAGVVLWGLSFFFGCQHLAYVSSTLFANAELLKVESGRAPSDRQPPGSNVSCKRRHQAGYRDKLQPRELLRSNAVRGVHSGGNLLCRVAYL